MRIFIYEEDATVRPPANFSPETLSTRNTAGTAAVFSGRPAPCGLAVGTAQVLLTWLSQRGLQGHGQRSPLESAARRCLR